MKSRIQLVGMMLATILVSSSVYGQISASGSFSLQGRLTNMNNGAAIADGQHTLVVSVYKRGVATAVYSENDTVPTNGGVFNILVGAGHATKLTLDATTAYEVGIALDGAAEMAPHIAMASAPRSILSNVADTSAVALNLGQHVLDSNVVSSLNGIHGAVNIMGGGSLVVTPTGQNIALSFTGSGAGLILPYVGLMPTPTGSLFTLTNSSTGSAASFSNTGTGGALLARDSLGTAVSAFSKGQSPTIDASNTGGVAINALSTVNAAMVATTNSNVSPAIIARNTASSGPIEYFQALNFAGTPVMDLSSTGLRVTTGAAAGTDAVLRLQNATSGVGSLISALDNTGSSLFNVSSNGTATLTNTLFTATDTSGTAISATTTAPNGPVLRLQNNSNAANAGILTALGSSGTVLTLAGNGATKLTAFGAGATALTVTNTTGIAISGTSTVPAGAVLQVQNLSTSGNAALLNAKDSAGNAILNVGVNGATQLRSSAATALDVATTATGGAGAKISGGLTLVGPAGTGTIPIGATSVTVSNPYATANSLIFVTINGSGTAQGIRVGSQSSGSFVVALVGTTPLVTALGFNFLIINTQ